MMKLNFRSSCIALSLMSISACANKLDTDKKKISYSIGQQIGESFKSQQIDIDVDTLTRSIRDAVESKPSKMTQDEMRAAMMTARSGAESKHKEEGTANLKKGQEYLDANKAKEGVQVTASGLQYRVLTPGKGERPGLSDNVLAHYKGTLIDGKEFDSSYGRGKPAEFPVSGVIPGWTEALQQMKTGEKRELVIPANLAYGESGRPGIPPNSVLVFEVELVSVKKAMKESSKVSKKK